MESIFEPLSPAETALLLDALPYITILVGAADDDLDPRELRAANALAEVRAYREDKKLRSYYEQIAGNFLARVQELSAGLPENRAEREPILWEKLSGLNAVLAKYPSPYDYYFYAAFRSFAKHVARAHGGFLRFLTVGPEEAKVMDLPMLTPVAAPEEEE